MQDLINEMKKEIENQLARIILYMDDDIIKNYDVKMPLQEVGHIHTQINYHSFKYEIRNNLIFIKREVERSDEEIKIIRNKANEILYKGWV